MGIELTKALFVRHAADLTASELVVLGYMCVVALDKPNSKGQPARMYFGGWGALSVALGYEEDSPAGLQKVKRAIQGLRKRGLVTPTVEHARTGYRQSYRLEVGIAGVQLPTPSSGTTPDPQEGYNSRPLRGSTSDPPRTNRGRAEDLLEDIAIAQVRDLKAARARKAAQDEIA